MKKLLIWLMVIVFVACSSVIATGCKAAATETTASETTASETKLSIALSFVVAGIPYGESCKTGGQKEADKLGVDFSFIAPATSDVAQQANQIQDLISKGVNGIGICALDPTAVSSVVKQASSAGIKVVGWDAGISDENYIYVVPTENLPCADHMVDIMAKLIGNKGEIAILTGITGNVVLNERIDRMKVYVAEKYPDMKIVAVESGEDDAQKSMVVATNLMTAYPNLKGIIANSSASVPGAGQAVAQAGKAGKVMVCGLSTPNQVKDLVHSGAIQCATLWSTEDLGGATVKVLYDLINGVEYKEGDALQDFPSYIYYADGNVVRSSEPLDFTKDNIDQYNF